MMHQLSRVNPVAGMMIDVDTWRTAHDYHRDHARLHNVALHGCGIVMGLEVLVGESVNALLIQPGVALDSAGTFVIVEHEQVHRVTSRVRGMIYLALRYRDAPAEPDSANAGPQTRVFESFTIEERTLPPTGTDLELARIDFDPQHAPIRAATDPNQPGRNEVDLRRRVSIGVRHISATDLAGESESVVLPAAPGGERPGASELNRITERLDDVARQVAALWERPQPAPSSSGPDVATIADAPTTGPATDGPASSAATKGPVTGAATDALFIDLRQRFENIAQQVDDLGERVKHSSAEREDLARQQQALDRQIGSLTRRSEEAGPELAQVRDRLDRMAPELERLTTVVEPLERQVQQLVDRSDSVVEQSWQTPDAAAGHELRLAIGRMRSAGWDQHRQGIRLLVRELVATVEPLARVVDEVQLSEVTQVELLYLTGYVALGLDGAEVQGIARVLESGGVVLAEGCAAGPSGETGAREFAFSFIELAQKLGRRLTRIERGHRLLEARYVFGDPPPGARPARVLEADGMIYSDADYGCAWQGGSATQALPRQVIRDAFEFGVNIAIYHQPRG